MTLNDTLVQLNNYLPETTPLDGVLVSLAIYLLSPKEDKMKNTFIVGAIHGYVHEVICHAEKLSTDPQTNNII